MEQRRGFRFPHIYYGWVLVGAAMIAGSFTTGVGVWGVSVMANPMTEALEWSRASFYGALTIHMLVAGALAPIVGPLWDTRNGPRRLMLLSAVLLGAALMGIRYVDSLWQFYLLFGVVGGVAQICGGMMLSLTILPKWFVRRRGRVMGLVAMGPGLGPMIFPVSIQSLIDVSDWRIAWFVLGIVAICLLLPLSFLVRTRPEDIGLLPDGDAPGEPQPNAAGAQHANPQPPAAVEGLTVRESIRLPSFWLLVAAFMLVGLGIGGFHANLVPYYQDIGLAASVAALSATAFAVASVSLRPLWGLLAERISVRFLIGPQVILSAGTVLLILNVGGQTSMLIASALHGATIGAFIALQGLLVANYFGRAHLGAISGVMRPFMTIAGAGSPLFIAMLFDLQDSYTLAFLIVAAGWVAAGVLTMLAAPPRMPSVGAAAAPASRSTGSAQ